MLWDHDGHRHMGWFIFGMVWMVLFWGGMAWLFVWGIRRTSGPGTSPQQGSALQIAQERYAKGDITKEQFEEIRRTLGQ